MSAPTLEILAPLRAAIAGVSGITSKLGEYKGSPAIFTRRPVPGDAPNRLITIGPIITKGEEDAVNDYRPVVVIDVIMFGEAERDYRDVETAADLIYQTFHRERGSISVTNYAVTEIRATGPVPVQGDGIDTIGRAVTLTISLYADGS